MQSINTLTQIIQQDNKIMTIEIYDFIITNGLQNRLIENIGNNIYQPNYYNLNFPIISFTCLSHKRPTKESPFANYRTPKPCMEIIYIQPF